MIQTKLKNDEISLFQKVSRIRTKFLPCCAVNCEKNTATRLQVSFRFVFRKRCSLATLVS